MVKIFFNKFTVNYPDNYDQNDFIKINKRLVKNAANYIHLRLSKKF